MFCLSYLNLSVPKVKWCAFYFGSLQQTQLLGEPKWIDITTERIYMLIWRLCFKSGAYIVF